MLFYDFVLFFYALKANLKYFSAYMPHLTEFSPSESQFPEEFSNLTEFLDKFIRDFMKKYIEITLYCVN